MEKLFQGYMVLCVAFAENCVEADLKNPAKAFKEGRCPEVPQGLSEGVAKEIFANALRYEWGSQYGDAEAHSKAETYASKTFEARKRFDVELAADYAKLTAKAAKSAEAFSVCENDGRKLLSIDSQRAKLAGQAARGDAAAVKVDRARLLAGLSPSQIKFAAKAEAEAQAAVKGKAKGNAGNNAASI